jgi:hypothetical protein
MNCAHVSDGVRTPPIDYSLLRTGASHTAGRGASTTVAVRRASAVRASDALRMIGPEPGNRSRSKQGAKCVIITHLHGRALSALAIASCGRLLLGERVPRRYAIQSSNVSARCRDSRSRYSSVSGRPNRRPPLQQIPSDSPVPPGTDIARSCRVSTTPRQTYE